MPTTYQKALPETVDVLDDLMSLYHTELRDAGVTIDLLCAFADPDSDECAVKAHGYPALAVVRKIGLKDRVKGCADAEIVLDGDKLDEWSINELKAILDHELTHLELTYDKDGNIKRDDLDRCKLNIRLHDRQFGWFDSVARRWKDDSLEVQQAVAMVEDWEFAQLYLPGFKPSQLGKVNRESFAESAAADRRELAGV